MAEHDWVAVAVYRVDGESLSREMPIPLLEDNLVTITVGCCTCTEPWPPEKMECPGVDPDGDRITSDDLREGNERQRRVWTTRPL